MDDSLIARAAIFHPWDAMAPSALEAILRRGPFQRTVETGCGGSTIVLSNISECHIAFAIEGENLTITELRKHPDLRAGSVTFVEGETRDTLPDYQMPGELDLILLDGPHAYPLPQIEYGYLSPHLRVGGWMVLDDIQIPSVHELFRFLQQESTMALEEVAVRTAFFRRLRMPEYSPDGWVQQGINRRTIWRYSWRDRLRRWLSKPQSRRNASIGCTLAARRAGIQLAASATASKIVTAPHSVAGSYGAMP